MSAKIDPVRRSVYIGRKHLGSYVQSGNKRFEAFSPSGQRLGIFTSTPKTLAAIRAVRERLECASEMVG